MEQKNNNIINCWNIILNNGKHLNFCDAEENVKIDGLEYIADPTFFRSASEKGLSGKGSNIELSGIISASEICYEDVKNGLYQNALVEVFLYNKGTSSRMTTTFYGYISRIDFSDDRLTAQLRDFATSLGNKFGDIYSPQCRVELGSAKCGVNLEDHRFEVRIEKILSPTKLQISRKFVSNYLKYARFKVVKEPEKSSVQHIDSNAGKVITLLKPFEFPLDGIIDAEITIGCDKTIETCSARFCNAINFRGEPFVPNLDKVLL